ncbi:MAG: deoxyribonuclease I [Planctomycetota bacterium]
MSEDRSGNPLQTLVALAVLGAGGYYAYNEFGDSVLEGISSVRGSSETNESFETYRDTPVMIGPTSTVAMHADEWSVTPPNTQDSSLPSGQRSPNFGVSTDAPTSADTLGRLASSSQQTPALAVPTPTASSFDGQVQVQSAIDRVSHRARPLKVATWSLDGFGPTKLASSDVRKYFSQVVRRYDIVALQQVTSIERDLIPRLVDVVNGPEHRYDFIIGPPTGPKTRGEQLVFLFDTTKVDVDRRQSYSHADRTSTWTYDPLIATFRAIGLPSQHAWTFTLINFRVDLSRAAQEVADISNVVAEVAQYRPGEDDVVLLGLMQADDEYLKSVLAGEQNDESMIQTAAVHRSTDVFDRYQTSNIVIDGSRTREYLGRGGVFDFRRHHDLSAMQAEAITSHLPVFAEFTAHEGGEL